MNDDKPQLFTEERRASQMKSAHYAICRRCKQDNLPLPNGSFEYHCRLDNGMLSRHDWYEPNAVTGGLNE